MPKPEELAAKEAAAAGGNKGAKEGEAPTPEALKAAQDQAENYRKELEHTRESLEAQKEELADLKAKIEAHEATVADKNRVAKLELGIEEDEELVGQLEAQARSGDRVAKAYLAAMQKTAERIAEKILAQKDLKDSFDRRDEFVEQLAKERKISAEEMFKLLNPYADMSLEKNPFKQVKKAFEGLVKEESIAKREAELKKLEEDNSKFRDNGTNYEGKTGGSSNKNDWNKPGAWREAKTQQEKESALATL